LDYPKLSLGLKFVVVGWELALNLIVELLAQETIEFLEVVTGHFLDLETAFVAKNFLNQMGCFNLFSDEELFCCYDFRFMFLLGVTLNLLEFVNVVFLVGINLRLEAPLLNSRIRKNMLLSSMNLAVYSFGLALNYISYEAKMLGNGLSDYKKFLEGKLSGLRDIFSGNYFC